MYEEQCGEDACWYWELKGPFRAVTCVLIANNRCNGQEWTCFILLLFCNKLKTGTDFTTLTVESDQTSTKQLVYGFACTTNI